MLKSKKKQNEDTKQASEPVVADLELLDRELKVTTISMLIALMDTVDNMQEQTDDMSREIKTKKEYQKIMLEINVTNKK